jgi:hypothetical protein
MKNKGLNLKQKGFYEILSSRTNLTKLVVTIWSICCMYMKMVNGLRHTEAKNFLTRFFFNRNRHTVPCIPNRYGKRGACAGLSYSLTPSTRRSISHWWARRVSVACLSHVLRGGTGRAGGEA